MLVTFPDGGQVTSTDREAMDARLSALAGKQVALVPLPPLHDKAAYRGVLTSKKDLRRQFGVADDEPLPDFSMFPLRKLAELAIYATPIGTFADAYPLHIVTTSSLRTMAANGGDFDVRRFRPNIVIDSHLEGLAEQRWIGGTLHAGDVSAHVEIPTIRCTIPLREQAGLPTDPAVMRTVSRLGDRCFGVYAEIAATGTLRVGDTVDLDPPPTQNALAASVARTAGRIKRNAVKTGNRMLPS